MYKSQEHKSFINLMLKLRTWITLESSIILEQPWTLNHPNEWLLLVLIWLVKESPRMILLNLIASLLGWS
jgi:hypothetical protein